MHEWNQTICTHSLVHCVYKKNNIWNIEVPHSEYGNYSFYHISTLGTGHFTSKWCNFLINDDN